MKYTEIKSIIRIVGLGWYGQTCGMDKELNGYDVANLEASGLCEELSQDEKREVIEGWLVKNSGDFQKILDFEADIELGDGSNVKVDWDDDTYYYEYLDCVYGSEYLEAIYGDED